MKKMIFMMIYDVIGSVFIGVSIVCFAVVADFAPGGVNGILCYGKLFGKHSYWTGDNLN